VCRIQVYAFDLCCNLSAYTLVAVSIERYLAVVHPISSLGFRSAKNTLIVLIGLWLVLPLVGIHALIIHEKVVDFEDEQGTYYKCSVIDDHTVKLVSGFWDFIFSFSLPSLTMAVLYACVLVRLKSALANQTSRLDSDKIKHVTRTVCTVVIVFFICWCPSRIMVILAVSSHPRSLPSQSG